MKKTAILVIAVLVLFTARPALANSAPIRYDDEGPHFTMGVLEGCDIGVEHEALDFGIHFEDEEPSFMDVSAPQCLYPGIDCVLPPNSVV